MTSLILPKMRVYIKPKYLHDGSCLLHSGSKIWFKIEIGMFQDILMSG